MPLFRCGFCLLVLSCLSMVCKAQEANFPTNDEINLLLTQTERAVGQYKPLLDQEESLFSAKGKEAVAKDREVVHGLETAIKAFRKNPQGFNSNLGFAFFEWIDDADRNVLLCASGASTEAVTLMLDGNTAKARSLAQLSQSCMDMSSLIYTVGENAGALYARFVAGEEALAKQAYDTMQKCTDILKKKGVKPNKP
jgi:hypothetical protein